MQVPGLPRSSKGVRDRVTTQRWPSRTVEGRGGPGGTKVEYQPPTDIQRQIDEIQSRNPMRDSQSDAAIRFAVSEAPNADKAYEAMRCIRDASDLIQRLRRDVGYAVPEPWSATLLELLVGGQITELGARRVLEQLKSYGGGDS